MSFILFYSIISFLDTFDHLMINIQFPWFSRSSDNQHSIFWLVFIIRYSVFWFLLIIIWLIFSFPDTYDQYSVCWILLSARHGVVSLLLPILTAGRVWRMKVVPKSLLAQHLFLNNPAANKLRFSRGTDNQGLKTVLKISRGMRGSDLLCNEDCPLITPSCQSLGPPT